MNIEAFASVAKLRWFKSSHSDNAGGECIEVAVDWFKSSYSDNEGGNCVGVGACPGTVHVRDSKDKTGPSLAFSTDAWAAFVAFAAQQTV